MTTTQNVNDELLTINDVTYNRVLHSKKFPQILNINSRPSEEWVKKFDDLFSG